MRKVTNKVCEAFLEKRRAAQDNTSTDGAKLWLYGHVISEWRGNEIWITNAGYFTAVTKDRLNALGARIYQDKGRWLIPTKHDKPKQVGTRWHGEWMKLNAIAQTRKKTVKTV